MYHAVLHATCILVRGGGGEYAGKVLLTLAFAPGGALGDVRCVCRADGDPTTAQVAERRSPAHGPIMQALAEIS